ncbi:MAG: DUF1553 domain-containing protein, partial [Bryobacteraceae bacterium]|nr:DUF1553 domain-containing protein [Bryobacteraceae bacterium]
DPALPWLELREARNFSAAAAELGARYAKESASRERFNRENFTPFDGWQQSGLGLETAAAGGFAVTGEGSAAINGIYPAGSYTHLVSSRLNGALRSPYLPKDRKYLSVRAMGGMLGARRTVIDNCAIGEDYKVIEGESPAWIKLETFAKEERLPVFVEFVTRWDNPRIPDRPGVLKEPQLKLMESPRSYFGLAGAVLHDVEEPPRATLSHMLPLFAQGAPSDAEDLAGRYAALARQAVDRWAANRADEDDARWLDWLVKQKLLSNEASALVARYREIEAGIEPPRVVEGLADIGHTNEPVPARYLEFLNGGGRRELAANIASASNPLTARVMVNRVWHHIFGRGIVATPDNFGAIGDAPSHPELLDYLAASFTGDGWSVKKLIRLLVTSETFRQSGMASAKAKELDPRNALLHHYPLRRLPAESLRDSLLAISGKLRPAMYGPSTDPHRAEAKDYRRLFSGPLDGAGRRSIYLKVTRMEGNTFLDTFDYPNPMAARGSRDVTNVPLQALTLLNDPFVVGEAEATARRLLAKPAASADDESVDERLGALFQLVLAREPDAAERERFAGLARELASLHKIPTAEAASSLPLWKDLAHAILNLKEFLYIP